MTASKWVSDVAEFIRKFHQDIADEPGWPSTETVNLRASLIKEEYLELADAWCRRDLPETVDAMIDLVYVLIGAMLALGVNPDCIWDAVHTANMAKEGGGRRADGKIQKPDGWKAPDVASIIGDQEPLLPAIYRKPC